MIPGRYHNFLSGVIEMLNTTSFWVAGFLLVLVPSACYAQPVVNVVATTYSSFAHAVGGVQDFTNTSTAAVSTGNGSTVAGDGWRVIGSQWIPSAQSGVTLFTTPQGTQMNFAVGFKVRTATSAELLNAIGPFQWWNPAAVWQKSIFTL